VHREPSQQRAEGLPVPVTLQSGQHLVLGRAQLLAELVEESQAARGGHDPPGPPVGWVRPPVDQAVRTGTRCSYSPAERAELSAPGSAARMPG
jgi:hypothetical protein